MAKSRTCFSCVCWLKVLFLAVKFASRNEGLKLDLNLTREEITTFLGQPANLGCYATKTNSSLTYSWTKDNKPVTQSSKVRAFGDLLVVTPKENADFGTYECNVTNGVSSTRCIISLLKGLNKTDYEPSGTSPSKSKTGCVNISVLMPVLAVAVMSLLLFVHLLFRGSGSRDNQIIERMMRKSQKSRSRHSEENTDVVEEPIAIHLNGSPVNGHASRSPVNGHTSRSPVIGHAPRSPLNGHASRLPKYQSSEDNHVTQC